MKKISTLFVPIFIMILCMGFVKSDSWYLLEATDLGFSIEFPIEPVKTNETQDTEAGSITTYTYRFEPGEGVKDDNLDYELVCTTMPISLEANTTNTKLSDAMFKKATDAILKSLHGKMISEKPFKFNGYPGKEVKIERKHKHEVYIMKLKLYFIKNKFFIIETTSTETKQTNKSAARFFSSFKMLN
jgi:hypothetical protein